MTRYDIIPPMPELAAFVRYFWVFEMDMTSGEPYVYRSIADGSAELVFHYNSPFAEFDTGNCNAAAVIHAQTQKHRRFATQSSFGIFGVYLYPYALSYLFGAPTASLTNELLSFDTMLGQDGRLLEEQVMTATNNAERVKILSAFIAQKVRSAAPRLHGIHHAVAHVISSRGSDSVSELSNKYCLSTRQFERKFKELSGFTPKMYSRIMRFQAATQHYGKDFRALSDIAYDCGYYDQSHFIHDFKEFSGYHPSAYFSGRPEGVEYREG